MPSTTASSPAPTRRARSTACSSVGRSVRITETGSTEPEVVRARLAERLREEGELDRLVERAIERFGYRR